MDFLHNVSENISTNEKEDVVKDSEATPEALNDENQTTQNIIEVGRFYHRSYTKLSFSDRPRFCQPNFLRERGKSTTTHF